MVFRESQSRRCVNCSGTCLPGRHGDLDPFLEAKSPAAVNSRANCKLTVSFVFYARLARCLLLA